MLCLILGCLLCLPARSPASENTPPAPATRILTFSTFPSEGMGILFERILREAYSRLGYEILINRVPAERALVLSNQGYMDGEAGRVPVIEARHPNLIRVPTPLYTNRIVAITKNARINPQEGWEDLAPYRIGAVIGYKYVEEKTKSMQCSYVSKYETLFSMLNADRIDIAVSEYLEALPTLLLYRNSNITSLWPALANMKMYHYLHKKNKALVPKINAVLQQMQRERRMEAILKELEAEYAAP